jgi:uncharacterized OB-fold protein
MARVRTFTVIHVGSERFAPTPYAVVIAEAEDGRTFAARADGELGWLRIGASLELVPDDAYGHVARAPRQLNESGHPEG